MLHLSRLVRIWRSRALVRHIAVILVIKTSVLFGIKALYFQPSPAAQSREALAEHLLAPAVTQQPLSEENHHDQ